MGKYDFMKLARMENSTALLKNMSFNVDISKLYSVVGSVCNNQANHFCPVQLRINDLTLAEHYGGPYLIQLWTNKQELVYQRVRNQPLLNRNLVNNYFIF